MTMITLLLGKTRRPSFWQLNQVEIRENNVSVQLLIFQNMFIEYTGITQVLDIQLSSTIQNEMALIKVPFSIHRSLPRKPSD